jgi:hypothetical protein
MPKFPIASSSLPPQNPFREKSHHYFMGSGEADPCVVERSFTKRTKTSLHPDFKPQSSRRYPPRITTVVFFTTRFKPSGIHWIGLISQGFVMRRFDIIHPQDFKCDLFLPTTWLIDSTLLEELVIHVRS